MLKTQDIDGLNELNDKTEEYLNVLFDWVSPLNQHILLEKLYNLQFEIEQTIKKISGAVNGN